MNYLDRDMLVPVKIGIGELRWVGEWLLGEAQDVHTRVSAVNATRQLHPRLELSTERSTMDGWVGGSGPGAVTIDHGHIAQHVPLLEAVIRCGKADLVPRVVHQCQCVLTGVPLTQCQCVLTGVPLTD